MGVKVIQSKFKANKAQKSSQFYATWIAIVFPDFYSILFLKECCDMAIKKYSIRNSAISLFIEHLGKLFYLRIALIFP